MSTELFKTRRSIKKYKSEQISDEELDLILEAGTYAPTGRNSQSPIIVAIQDPELLKELSLANAAVLGMESDPFYGAPAVLVVLEDKNWPTFVYDGSLVMGNLMLAAHSLGLGSCWVQCRLREAADGRSTEEYVRDILHFPETHRLEAILALGVIDTHPEPYTPDQLRTDKIHYETF